MKIFLSLQLVSLISCVYIALDKKIDHCFYRILNKDQDLFLTYIVSGQNEDQVAFKVNFQEKQLLHQIGKKDFQYTLNPDQTGEYSFCFQNLDGEQKILAFDLIELKSTFQNDVATKGFILNLGDLDATIQNFHNNYINLEKIQNNQSFQDIRDNNHSKLIKEIEDKIRKCSIVKVLVLIFISAIQIFILSRFFKNKGKITV